MSGDSALPDDNSPILRIQGTALPDESGQISRREMFSFRALVPLLGKKLAESADLLEIYARAKVAQEKNLLT